MPIVTMFRAQSGELFETEVEECMDDLRRLVGSLIDSEAIAKRLTTALSDRAKFEEFRTIVTRLNEVNKPTDDVIKIDHPTVLVEDENPWGAKFVPHVHKSLEFPSPFLDTIGESLNNLYRTEQDAIAEKFKRDVETMFERKLAIHQPPVGGVAPMDEPLPVCPHGIARIGCAQCIME